MTFNVTKWGGEPISRPGLYEGVPNAVYHSGALCVGPSMSSTGLRTIFHKSPKHYWYASPYNPKAKPQDETDALVLGRAAHHALLGEAEFGKSYVVRPEKINGKPWVTQRGDCKEWLDEAAKSGLTVLTPDQRDAILGMRDELVQHPMLDPKGSVRLLDGLVEHTICWQDDETGVWLKVRPDVIPLDTDMGADLKTASDVTPAAIENTIGAYGLNMQAALVGMAWRAVFGRPMTDFSLVFVESKAPHCVEIVTLKPHDIETGERQVRAALRLFVKCMNDGAWPGPGGVQSDAKFVEIKPWHRGQIEARLSMIEQEIAT